MNERFKLGTRVKAEFEGVLNTYFPGAPEQYAVTCGDRLFVVNPEHLTVLEDPKPEYWPPQPGDLWKDRDGELWFARVSAAHSAGVSIVGADGGFYAMACSELLKLDPTLEYRPLKGMETCEGGC